MKKPLKATHHNSVLCWLIMSTCALTFFFYSSFSSAQNNNDTEVIFNWGENNFSQFFPDHRMTLTAGPWQYRFYPQTNIYLGARDSQVFVLGGPFGNTEPVFVNTVSNLRTQIDSDPGVPACKNPSDGFVATQSDNILNINPDNQCINIPDEICQTSFSSTSTGNAVLITTTLTSTSFSGIEFDNPKASTILDLFNDAVTNKICTLNTPTNLINLITNIDICKNVSYPLLSESELETLGITINAPITQKLTTTSSSQLVSDCFTSDAEIIFDLFSGESWIKQEDGSFTQNPVNTSPGQLIQQVKLEKFNEDFNILIKSGNLNPDDPTQENVEALAKNSGCFNCHNIDTKLVGPSFKEIALKYSNDTNAVQYLANQIRNGSLNVWSIIPMPPNANVNEIDAAILADWILSLQ